MTIGRRPRATSRGTIAPRRPSTTRVTAAMGRAVARLIGTQ